MVEPMVLCFWFMFSCERGLLHFREKDIPVCEQGSQISFKYYQAVYYLISQSNLGGDSEVSMLVHIFLSNSNKSLKDSVTTSKAKNTRGYMRLHPEEKLEELHGAPWRQGTRRNEDSIAAPSSWKPKHKNASKSLLNPFPKVHALSSKSFESDSLGFFNSLFDKHVQEEMKPHRKECTQV